MHLRFLLVLFVLKSLTVSAQDDFSSASIPKNLTENANAVVRFDQTDINILKRNKMVIKTRRAVTILNETGMRFFDAAEVFRPSREIKEIEALIYDASGKQIKKYKRKDFREHSLSEGAYIVEGKVLELDYTPVAYPFTLVFTSEVETTNTAFIPQWSPVAGTLAGTQKSGINITWLPELGFKFRDYNFTDVTLAKTEGANTLSLSAENIAAIKREEYSPAFYKMKPYVLFALEKFHLEGVDGEAQSWQALGKWMNDNLLADTDELTPETQAKIKALVGTETDPLKKARIVYNYVQSKTRYVLIALGIGGWKPMPATDVDRLGYGDCKALSNYTRALLKVVGVDAFCAVVYSGDDRRDMREDFVSMQGDHMILAIPQKDGIVWLECTSQVAPFGFQGDFTDNRLVMLIKPEGGEIVRTHVYDTKGNSQASTGSYSIAESGAISGEVHIASRGLQYGNRYRYETFSPDDMDKMYKRRFNNINNLKLTKTGLKNDKDGLQLDEDIFISAESYCSKSGDRIIFPINAFNQLSSVPQRYRTRKMPFEISFGFYDTDEITVNLPEGFNLEAKPENVSISDKFGEYKAEYELNGTGQIVFKRTLLLKEGAYGSAEYENYRQFMEKVSRTDNAKVVLVKKQ
ncbi:transglutaminase [Flavobacterium akiainvivens]|uniref:Transglutaminase n=1 Tax=Flavobacterium akiainvivens TaxID=1202724 RepID=A0A0M9VI59_9FLAO|nr:DUF3857 domain-containing protein [Flavobacterium akiainvivens]KOS06316.1 transglutaminase [Flavobacterium akiainvivens]SFQ16465.1 Transglutaminase-like superfamily protein [Flavobacterium akiainvivens]